MSIEVEMGGYAIVPNSTSERFLWTRGVGDCLAI